MRRAPMVEKNTIMDEKSNIMDENRTIMDDKSTIMVEKSTIMHEKNTVLLDEKTEEHIIGLGFLVLLHLALLWWTVLLNQQRWMPWPKSWIFFKKKKPN